MYVFYILVVYMDSDTYVGTQPHKVLKNHDRWKKGKHLEACLYWRKHFTPRVLLMDSGMIEKKKVATKELPYALSNKWDR